jgi:hypothetical protein
LLGVLVGHSEVVEAFGQLRYMVEIYLISGLDVYLKAPLGKNHATAFSLRVRLNTRVQIRADAAKESPFRLFRAVNMEQGYSTPGRFWHSFVQWQKIQQRPHSG